MYDQAQKQVANDPRVFPEFYVFPRRQLIKAEKLIREHPEWGLGLSDIPYDIPSFDGLGLNEFWVLVFYLPAKGFHSSTLVTLEAYFKVINKQTPIYVTQRSKKAVKGPALRPRNVLPLSGKEHQPGIFWEKLNFAGGHQSENIYDGIDDIRKKYPVERLATFAVFSALMLMPRWYKSMNGLDIPYVMIPGFKVCPDGISKSCDHWNYFIYVSPRMAVSKSKIEIDNLDIGRFKDHKPRPGWACCLIG